MILMSWSCLCARHDAATWQWAGAGRAHPTPAPPSQPPWCAAAACSLAFHLPLAHLLPAATAACCGRHSWPRRACSCRPRCPTHRTWTGCGCGPRRPHPTRRRARLLPPPRPTMPHATARRPAPAPTAAAAAAAQLEAAQRLVPGLVASRPPAALGLAAMPARRSAPAAALRALGRMRPRAHASSSGASTPQAVAPAQPAACFFLSTRFFPWPFARSTSRIRDSCPGLCMPPGQALHRAQHSAAGCQISLQIIANSLSHTMRELDCYQVWLRMSLSPPAGRMRCPARRRPAGRGGGALPEHQRAPRAAFGRLSPANRVCSGQGLPLRVLGPPGWRVVGGADCCDPRGARAQFASRYSQCAPPAQICCTRRGSAVGRAPTRSRRTPALAAWPLRNSTEEAQRTTKAAP